MAALRGHAVRIARARLTAAPFGRATLFGSTTLFARSALFARSTLFARPLSVGGLARVAGRSRRTFVGGGALRVCTTESDERETQRQQT